MLTGNVARSRRQSKVALFGHVDVIHSETGLVFNCFVVAVVVHHLQVKRGRGLVEGQGSNVDGLNLQLGKFNKYFKV